MAKTKRIFSLIALLFLAAGPLLSGGTGCASARAPEYDWIDKDYDGRNENGEILLIGKGSAAEKFRNRPNEELMAEEAAVADAKAKVIEQIIGSYLEANIEIKDRDAVEQFAKTNLQGRIKGLVIKKRYFDPIKKISHVLVKIEREDIKNLYNKLNEKFNLDIKYEK